MKLAAAVLFFAISVAVTQAHLCNLAPPQRGGLTNCGSANPYLIGQTANACCALAPALTPADTAPCGGVTAGSALATLTAGASTSVVFLKNENHWFSSSIQGTLNVTYFPSSGSAIPLWTTTDLNTASGTIYVAPITVPNIIGSGYIQVLYYTANPGVANTTFYQCSDVLIAAAAATSSSSTGSQGAVSSSSTGSSAASTSRGSPLSVAVLSAVAFAVVVMANGLSFRGGSGKTSTVLLGVIVILAMLSVSQAHVCMLQPLQRGSLANCVPFVANVANTCCQLAPFISASYVAPCGGVASGQPVAQLKANQAYTVTFVKNEDHWNASPQGNFTVSYYPAGGSPVALSTITDTNSGAGAIYSVSVTTPNILGNGFFQVTYWTANPAVGSTTFYQCSDVILTS